MDKNGDRIYRVPKWKYIILSATLHLHKHGKTSQSILLSHPHYFEKSEMNTEMTTSLHMSHIVHIYPHHILRIQLCTMFYQTFHDVNMSSTGCKMKRLVSELKQSFTTSFGYVNSSLLKHTFLAFFMIFKCPFTLEIFAAISSAIFFF